VALLRTPEEFPLLDVPVWVYLATVAAFAVLLAVDLFVVDHKPHAVSIREATYWVLFYVALAIAFGIGVYFVGGGQPAAEFFAGYLIEYSLSVDNLFVFVIIMTTFAVPAIHQHKVLLFGIVLALILRGLFIAAGAAAIERFSWVFYIFGAFLIFTAVQLARHRDEEPELGKNPVLRIMERVLPTTQEYDGAKVVTRVDGKRVVTPLLIVMVAIGSTDILFALDSIPAIFGVTQEPYLVFTANAFALMGLRQLYFLINGLLDRLVYLSVGLSVILGFIGVKLLLHALHEDGIDAGHLGSGTWEVLPEIGIGTSLAVIVGVLAITVVASLAKVRRDPSAAKKLGAAPAPAQELRHVPEDARPRE
jgi:tellurite resistance protein TerC